MPAPTVLPAALTDLVVAPLILDQRLGHGLNAVVAGRLCAGGAGLPGPHGQAAPTLPSKPF